MFLYIYIFEYIYIYIQDTWRFPKMGVPANHPFFWILQHKLSVLGCIALYALVQLFQSFSRISRYSRILSSGVHTCHRWGKTFLAIMWNSLHPQKMAWTSSMKCWQRLFRRMWGQSRPGGGWAKGRSCKVRLAAIFSAGCLQGTTSTTG